MVFPGRTSRIDMRVLLQQSERVRSLYRTLRLCRTEADGTNFPRCVSPAPPIEEGRLRAPKKKTRYLSSAQPGRSYTRRILSCMTSPLRPSKVARHLLDGLSRPLLQEGRNENACLKLTYFVHTIPHEVRT